jgi:PIN domain nuclease of toxin-antitoxin system
MLLLDTHAVIWLATDLSQLTDHAKAAILFHASELYISSITALEISLLVRGGKLKWGRNPHECAKQSCRKQAGQSSPCKG